MEINITDFFCTGQANLYSASAAELGENAGKLTWLNALSYSNKHRMLDTEDQLEAFKSLFDALAAGLKRKSPTGLTTN